MELECKFFVDPPIWGRLSVGMVDMLLSLRFEVLGALLPLLSTYGILFGVRSWA